MTNIWIDVGITLGLIAVLGAAILCLAYSNVKSDNHTRQKTTAIRVLFITMLIVLLIGSFAIIFI